MSRLEFLDTQWVENFDKIALTVKEPKVNLYFCNFGEFQNETAYLGRIQFLENCHNLLDTLWVEKFDEIALSVRVLEIFNNCYFYFATINKATKQKLESNQGPNLDSSCIFSAIVHLLQKPRKPTRPQPY